MWARMRVRCYIPKVMSRMPLPLPTRVLALALTLACLLVAALQAAPPARASSAGNFPTYAIAVPTNGACHGNGATTSNNGQYISYWGSQPSGGTNCSWTTGRQGGGVYVAYVAYYWNRSSACTANMNRRYADFGVSGSSSFPLLLWACSGAGGPYVHDVSMQSVGPGEFRHTQTSAAPNSIANEFTQSSSLQFTYEDRVAPTINSFSVAYSSQVNGWGTGVFVANGMTSDNNVFNGGWSGIWVDGGSSPVTWDSSCADTQNICYSSAPPNSLLDPGADGVHSVSIYRATGDGSGIYPYAAITASPYYIDRNSPSTPVIGAANGYVPGNWSNQPVTVSVTAPSSDGTGSGVSSYSWPGGLTGNSVTYSADGYYFPQATANDGAGHSSSASNSVDVRVDRTAPPAPAVTGAPADGTWSNSTSGVPLTIGTVVDAMSGVDPSSGYTYRYRTSTDGTTYGAWSPWLGGTSFTVGTDGWTQFEARATDRAGNVSTSTAKTVQLDRTPPSFPGQLSSEGDWICAANQVVAVGGATDSGPSSGFTYEHRIKGPGDSSFGGWTTGDSVTVSAEGETTVEFRIRDNAGNTSATVTKVVRLDCSPPTDVTITGGSLNWLNRPSTNLTGSASDAVSGVDRYTWQTSIDGGATWADSSVQAVILLISAEGETLVRAKAVDRAGNASVNWAPVSHRTDPVEPDGDATVRLDRTNPGMPPIEWVVDGTATTTDPQWVNSSAPVTLRVQDPPGASDSPGGLDLTRPYDMAVAGTAGSCPAASDPSWTEGSSATIDTEGFTRICFRARDKAGNLSAAASGLIRIDRAAPRAPAITGDSASWQQGHSKAITVSPPPIDPSKTACSQASDPYCDATPADATGVSGVDHYEYQASRNGGPMGAPQAIGAGGRFLLTAGQWSFQARAVDEAGNVSEWTTELPLNLADADQSLVRSWGLGNLQNALCRLPSITHAADVDRDCAPGSVGGPDWDRHHRN